MDPLQTINFAITIAGHLIKASEQIKDVQFKNLLAELSSTLADSQLQIASLKTTISELQEENRCLKQKQDFLGQPRKIQDGCYVFDGDDQRYCIKCFHDRLDKCPVQYEGLKVGGHQFKCLVCHSSVYRDG
jgi:hypothetical protein